MIAGREDDEDPQTEIPRPVLLPDADRIDW
jgi:hypothetical protein